ncbi:MAG: hypothetical protein ACTHJR_00295 [Sphingomonas sp.]|uniref:hypothetical protein n=1 Tax=Sphingomonas sp. TaxID=28214 RepID=UPI003F7E502F
MELAAVLAVTLPVALIFCIVRLIVDLRGRRAGWAVADLAVAGLLVWTALAPIQTHAVKVDLIPASR